MLYSLTELETLFSDHVQNFTLYKVSKFVISATKHHNTPEITQKPNLKPVKLNHETKNYQGSIISKALHEPSISKVDTVHSHIPI